MSMLFSYVQDAAKRHAENPALCVEGKTWTYLQLLEASGRLTRFIADIGAGEAGGSFALIALRTLPAYPTMLGILQSGNTYVPISSSWPAGRIVQVLKQSRSMGLFVDAAHASMLAQALGTYVGEMCWVELETGNGTTVAY